VAGLGFNAGVSTFNASAGPMYRVRVGPESSRERAVEIVSSLSMHGFVAQVVGQD
jgi:cell division protein FtsN